jgi:hypothetical protein
MFRIRGGVETPSSEVFKFENPFQIDKKSIITRENEIEFKFHSKRNLSIHIHNLSLKEFETNVFFQSFKD